MGGLNIGFYEGFVCEKSDGFAVITGGIADF
jgi:hypothetical protein